MCRCDGKLSKLKTLIHPYNKCTKVVVTLTSASVSELLEFGHLLPDVDLVVLEEDA